MGQSGANLDTLSDAFPEDVDQHAGALLQRACDLDLRIATAESCTGGLLASVLTDVKGCSHAFERGFVTYTDQAKHQVLDVPLELIESDTAVSKRVAVKMAEGGLKASDAHLCIAVTGYADDADGQVQAGLVHFALAKRSGETHHQCHEFGDLGRGRVRIACIRIALRMLDEAVGQSAAERSVA